MGSLILLIALVQVATQGVSPCDAEKLRMGDRSTPLTIAQICRLERRMSLITDGMSWNTVMKTIGISRKNVRVIARGGMTYRYLGSGYTLASPFYSEQQAKRIVLLDRQGKTVKDIQWR